MKSLLIRIPAAEDFEALDPIWQDAIIALHGKWTGHGKSKAGNRVIDALVSPAFIVPGETDAMGTSLTPTDLPPGWILMMAWRYDPSADAFIPLMTPHPQLIDHQPDVVSFDAAGNETGRSAATELKEVQRFAGWPARSFT